MDPDEIRFIGKAFNKERGAEIFRKSAPPQCSSPVTAPSRTAIQKRIPNVGMKSIGGTCVGFFIG
jgi:hypothetical protein